MILSFHNFDIENDMCDLDRGRVEVSSLNCSDDIILELCLYRIQERGLDIASIKAMNSKRVALKGLPG